YFYKMKVENNGNFTQLSQIPNNLGLISATARSGNDHIVCTESGNYALVNNTGGVIWSQQLSGRLLSVTNTGDGIALCGSKNTEAFLIKTDQNGNLLWEKNFPLDSLANDIVIDNAGNLIWVGMSKTKQLVVRKLDKTG